MSYLDKVRACNTWAPAGFLPWTLAGDRLGWLRHGFAEHLRRWPERFRVDAERVDWIGAPPDLKARSESLGEVVATLAAEGLIGPLLGECYAVTPAGRAQARCLIDRSAVPCFGVRAFGQHLNGYVRTRHGIELWIGRRAADRRSFPGHLDNLVAGGLPYGVDLRENLRKECREEADIDPEVADRAVAVGAVTYCREAREGVKPDVMFLYDLELPESFAPHNTDGEVESFTRMPLAEAARLVSDTSEFKLNCNLVVIDFLVRHGAIDQEHPDYVAIVQGLRSPLP